jgi:hypothetical protein
MAMKKLFCMTLMILFSFLLGACAKATQQAAGPMINPGDRIGDFMITTGLEGKVFYSNSSNCPDQGDQKIFSCRVIVGHMFNITSGLYDEAFLSSIPAAKLNEAWSAYRYELFIEGQPVNLQAFGSIDINTPDYGVMRYWNIVIVTDKPGKITVHDAGTVAGQPFDHTTTYIYLPRFR